MFLCCYIKYSEAYLENFPYTINFFFVVLCAVWTKDCSSLSAALKQNSRFSNLLVYMLETVMCSFKQQATAQKLLKCETFKKRSRSQHIRKQHWEMHPFYWRNTFSHCKCNMFQKKIPTLSSDNQTLLTFSYHFRANGSSSLLYKEIELIFKSSCLKIKSENMLR